MSSGDSPAAKRPRLSDVLAGYNDFDLDPPAAAPTVHDGPPPSTYDPATQDCMYSEVARVDVEVTVLNLRGDKILDKEIFEHTDPVAEIQDRLGKNVTALVQECVDAGRAAWSAKVRERVRAVDRDTLRAKWRECLSGRETYNGPELPDWMLGEWKRADALFHRVRRKGEWSGMMVWEPIRESAWVKDRGSGVCLLGQCAVEFSDNSADVDLFEERVRRASRKGRGRTAERGGRRRRRGRVRGTTGTVCRASGPWVRRAAHQARWEKLNSVLRCRCSRRRARFI